MQRKARRNGQRRSQKAKWPSQICVPTRLFQSRLFADSCGFTGRGEPLWECVPLSFTVLLLARRPVYVAAVRPQSKHIVVMVDHGASVTDTQLQIARDSALIILNAIDEHDKVCLFRSPPGGCYPTFITL